MKTNKSKKQRGTVPALHPYLVNFPGELWERMLVIAARNRRTALAQILTAVEKDCDDEETVHEIAKSLG